MVCAKKHSNDKVKWNSIAISQWNSTLGVFLGLECVPFGSVLLWLYSLLVFNEQRIFAFVNVYYVLLWALSPIALLV